MGARQRVWAAKARDALMAELGGCCAACGTTEKLTFDCIDPQGDKHHKVEWSARISFYRKQYREHKNIQILCEEHQNVKSRIDRQMLDRRLQNVVQDATSAGLGAACGTADSEVF